MKGTMACISYRPEAIPGGHHKALVYESIVQCSGAQGPWDCPPEGDLQPGRTRSCLLSLGDEHKGNTEWVPTGLREPSAGHSCPASRQACSRVMRCLHKNGQDCCNFSCISLAVSICVVTAVSSDSRLHLQLANRRLQHGDHRLQLLEAAWFSLLCHQQSVASEAWLTRCMPPSARCTPCMQASGCCAPAAVEVLHIVLRSAAFVLSFGFPQRCRGRGAKSSCLQQQSSGSVISHLPLPVLPVRVTHMHKQERHSSRLLTSCNMQACQRYNVKTRQHSSREEPQPIGALFEKARTDTEVLLVLLLMVASRPVPHFKQQEAHHLPHCRLPSLMSRNIVLSTGLTDGNHGAGQSLEGLVSVSPLSQCSLPNEPNLQPVSLHAGNAVSRTPSQLLKVFMQG